jgi:hypothetical protein
VLVTCSLGVDSDRYEVLAKELGGFYVSMTLLQKYINARWECLVVSLSFS